jgi:O-antigen/teichoic acid export membrane protein
MSITLGFGKIKLGLVNVNIIGNYVGALWINALSLISIPIYIRLLGTREWGIAVACSSLIIISNLVDLGFSQIVPTWFARASINYASVSYIYLKIRRIYMILAVLLMIAIQLLAPLLSRHWFNIPSDQAATLELAIRIVSLQFAFQFVNNLYIGAWQGLQMQLLANSRLCIFGTLKYILTLIALYIRPAALVFVATYLIVSIIECASNSILFASQVKAKARIDEGTESLSAYSKIVDYRQVLTLSAGIFIGIFTSQIDKIYLSKVLDLEIFGIYSTVATFALGLLQLHAPLSKSYLPIFSSCFDINSTATRKTLRSYLYKTIVFAIAPVLLIFCFSEHILALWLHNQRAVEVGLLPMRLLLIAVIINMIYSIVYTLLLANQRSSVVAKINAISLFIAASFLFFFHSPHLGVAMGGILFILISLTQLTMGLLWLKNSPLLSRRSSAR